MSTKNEFATNVIRILQDVLVKQKEKEHLPLHEPVLSGNEWCYIKDCLDSGWVSSVGKYVDAFEENLASYTGVKKAVAVVNGTAALHISLLLAGIGPQDEVIVPTLTFAATANAVAYTGAIPHFADCDEQTLGIDADKLDAHLADIGIRRQSGLYNRMTERRIRALVVMHTFGHPSNMDKLIRIADRYRLTLIEDAAESLGSFYKGTHTGNFGKVAAMSFNGNKVLTTGGGGAILTNDEALAARAKHLTTTAKAPHSWEISHDELGYNYRMPNLNAALGCAQLEQLPAFLNKKRHLAENYQNAFSLLTGIRFFQEPADAKSNFWLNALILEKPDSFIRDDILHKANMHGLMVRPIWRLMHRLPMYAHCPTMELKTAERMADSIINIPSSAYLGGD